MNSALMRKTSRDYILLLLAVCVALCGFLTLYIFATNAFLNDKELEKVLQAMPWVKNIIDSLAGAEVTDGFNPTGLASFGFSHPVMWSVSLAFLITLTSGVLAGEIDRGTMDILGALPISRSSIYISLCLVAILCSIPMSVSVWLGVYIGSWFTGADVDTRVLGIVTGNLFISYVFLGAFSLMCSAASQRRGTAVLVVFCGIFYSFVISVIASFWPEAKWIEVTAFLYYYQPLPIVRAHAWPLSDMLVLMTATVVCWIVGWVTFCRRDIPAR